MVDAVQEPYEELAWVRLPSKSRFLGLLVALELVLWCERNLDHELTGGNMAFKILGVPYFFYQFVKAETEHVRTVFFAQQAQFPEWLNPS